MQIDKDSSVAVIVKRSWANLYGVRLFLNDNPQAEMRGVDESHILFAKVLDAEDARGVWIEVVRPDPFRILIPWNDVLAIVVGKEFSPAIRQEARKIGFTGETERE